MLWLALKASHGRLDVANEHSPSAILLLLTEKWLLLNMPQAWPQPGIRTLFLIDSLFIFQSVSSHAISRRISLSLSFLLGLHFPLENFCIPFLSHDRHSGMRRVLWNLQVVDRSPYSAPRRRASCLAIQSFCFRVCKLLSSVSFCMASSSWKTALLVAAAQLPVYWVKKAITSPRRSRDGGQRRVRAGRATGSQQGHWFYRIMTFKLY